LTRGLPDFTRYVVVKTEIPPYPVPPSVIITRSRVGTIGLGLLDLTEARTNGVRWWMPSPAWAPWQEEKFVTHQVISIDEAGRWVELDFKGTVVGVMVGSIAPDRGIINCYVDGALKKRIDLYNPAWRPNMWHLIADDLEDKDHTVRIENSGEKNPAATEIWAEILGIVVNISKNPKAVSLWEYEMPYRAIRGFDGEGKTERPVVVDTEGRIVTVSRILGYDGVTWRSVLVDTEGYLRSYGRMEAYDGAVWRGIVCGTDGRVETVSRIQGYDGAMWRNIVVDTDGLLRVGECRILGYDGAIWRNIVTTSDGYLQIAGSQEVMLAQDPLAPHPLLVKTVASKPTAIMTERTGRQIVKLLKTILRSLEHKPSSCSSLRE